MQVFLCRSVEFSIQYRQVSKLPFCTQFFAVSCVNVCSTSRASARLWLCSSDVIKFLVLGLAQRSGKTDAYSANLAVGVLAQYGLICSQHERTVPKGYKVISSPGFSPYNLHLSVFSYESDHMSGYGSEKITFLHESGIECLGVGRGWCLALPSGGTPRPCGRVIL